MLKFLKLGNLKQRFYSTYKLDGIVRRFNDVHIQQDALEKFNENLQEFDASLKETLIKYEEEKRSSVWMYVPMELSHFIKILHKYDFKYHHAENNEAVLYKWLPKDRQSSIPRFATHQMGVAGLVLNETKRQILCIKDKHSPADFWKLPGGAADLGESIHETCVREVREETGIESRFESILGLRQVHNYPGGHGRSDVYVVCRLTPLTFQIKQDTHEIQSCEWLDLDYLAHNYNKNPLLNHLSQLVLNNLNNLSSIDIKRNELTFASNNKTFYFYSK